MTKIPENTQYKESTTIPAQKINIPTQQETPKDPTKPEPTTPRVGSDFGSRAKDSIFGNLRESTTIPVPPQKPLSAPVSAPKPIDRSGVQKVERSARRGSFLDYYSDPIRNFRSNAVKPTTSGYNQDLKPLAQESIERDFPIGRSMKSRIFKDKNGNRLPFQCGELINHLTHSTVGNYLAEKKRRIDYGINWNNVKPGNTVVVDIGNYGHVAAVVDTIKDRSGKVIGVRVVEANKDLRGTVNYGTYMANSGRVLGFQNTSFIPKYSENTNLGYDLSNIFNNRRS